MVVKPLQTGTNHGKVVLIAPCDRCTDCSRAWCFSVLSNSTMKIEACGDCTGNKNLKRIRRETAKTYARNNTTGKAKTEMLDNVPDDEKPPDWQLKNYRPVRDKQKEKYSASCLGTLQQFLDSPPEGIVINSQTMNADTVRIAFSVPQATEVLQKLQMHSF